MPLFWKKSTTGKDGTNSTSFGSPTNNSPSRESQVPLHNGGLSSSRPSAPSQQTPERRPRQPRVLQNFASAPNTLRRRSRLSPSLVEVLRDGEACQYFLQFLETRDSAHLFQFWLDAESFQASTKARISSHTRQNSLKQKRLHAGSGSSEPCSREGRTSRDETEAVAGDHPQLRRVSSCSIEDTKTESGAHESSITTEGLSRKLDTDYLSFGSERTKVELTPCTADGADGTDYSAHKRGSVDSAEVLTFRPLAPQTDDKIIQKLHKCIEENAVKIFTKYIGKDATHPIGISDELRNGVTGMICSESGNVNPVCFAATQKFVADVLAAEYFKDFLQSEYYCRHQIEVLTNGTVTLADILYNEISLSFFMEEVANNLLFTKLRHTTWIKEIVLFC